MGARKKKTSSVLFCSLLQRLTGFTRHSLCLRAAKENCSELEEAEDGEQELIPDSKRVLTGNSFDEEARALINYFSRCMIVNKHSKH